STGKQPSKQPGRFLIAAGGSRYDDPGLAELPKVVSDIASVSNLFDGLEYSKVLTNLSKEATANRLRDQLIAWFSEEPGKDGDVAVFYFPGHAYSSPSREHYLCTRDFDPKQPFTKGVAASVLPRLFFEGRGRKILAVWILLDTCYSGLGALDI